jgi:ribonuclease BN (tRNA processing enzyme)
MIFMYFNNHWNKCVIIYQGRFWIENNTGNQWKISQTIYTPLHKDHVLPVLTVSCNFPYIMCWNSLLYMYKCLEVVKVIYIIINIKMTFVESSSITFWLYIMYILYMWHVILIANTWCMINYTWKNQYVPIPPRIENIKYLPYLFSKQLHLYLK